MSSIKALDNYLINAILEKVTHWVEKRSEILALALVGSYARGEAKPDSDIDLMVIASDTEIFRQNHGWVHQINWESIDYKIQQWNDAQYGVVWSRHIDLYNSKSNLKSNSKNNSKNNLSKKLKVEISFGLPKWASVNPVDSGTFGVVSRGCKIIYDPQGILTNLISKINL
ncbi:MAG: nucleotidyltransferase domain-containing protein [Cyanobacteria bacterium J06621_15]